MSRKYLLLSLPMAALILTIGHHTAQPEPASPASPVSMGPAPTTTFPMIEIIDAIYGGTGCPEGSASVVFAGNTLSMLFDAYVARTSTGNRTDRKSCNYAVALKIPAGYTIALFKIDYRGFADIPSGGVGILSAEYFWAGSSGPIHTRYFPAHFFGNWLETDFVATAVWSPCGGEAIARGNTNTVARKSSPSSSHEAELSVDSLDLQGGVIYYFDWDYC